MNEDSLVFSDWLSAPGKLNMLGNPRQFCQEPQHDLRYWWPFYRPGSTHYHKHTCQKMEWAYLLNYSPGKRKKIVLFACMVVIVYQGVHTLPKMNRVLHGLSTILTNKSTTRVATVPVIDPVESTYDSRRASEKRLEKSALECVKHKIVYNRTISTVLVSNEYRVIINVIPKVGSGTWKRLMRGIDPTSANAKGRRRLNFLKSSEYDQYVSGVFFREPLHCRK